MSLTLDARAASQSGARTGDLLAKAALPETHAHLACAAGSFAACVLLILMAGRPAGAQSQMQGPSLDRPAPAALSLAPVQGSVLPPAYPVRGLDLKPTTLPSRHDGWGFVASVGGHSTDLSSLSSPDNWTYNPSAGNGDLEAGLSWQRGGVSTVVGYSQFDKGRGVAAAPIGGRPKYSRGVLGLSTRILLP